MDKSVITKVIEHCGVPCPDFNFENPLLDKNTADLLAKGFVKLLNNRKLSSENHRLLVLENIRKSCKVEPPRHLNIDDNVTEVLQNAYKKLPDDRNINKELDSFLIRNLKDININSHHAPSYKPDIIQALVNLNKDEHEINDLLVKDIIYWNTDSKGYTHLLNKIWKKVSKNSPTMKLNDVAIKMKPLMEQILLPCALEMLQTVIVDDDWFSHNKELVKLILICSGSSECFQVCTSILNSLFIKTKFDNQIRSFINFFIDSIKIRVEHISQLYAANLQHIVVLLDIKLDTLADVQTTYITQTLKLLNSLHIECESDLIMLLSHFNDWFDLYYNSKFD